MEAYMNKCEWKVVGGYQSPQISFVANPAQRRFKKSCQIFVFSKKVFCLFSLTRFQFREQHKTT